MRHLPSWIARPSVAAALAVVVAATGCGKQPARDRSWFPQSHANAAPGETPEARRFPAMEREEAAQRLADAVEENRPFEVIVFANRLVGAGGALDAGLEEQVRVAVDSLSADRVRAVWAELDPVAPAELVAMRLAMLAEHRGDDHEALDWYARVSGNPSLEESARDRADRLRARREVADDVIAVLLPLSGRYARIGAEMRDAIELAASRQGGAKLHFLDTAGEADAAMQAVDSAVHEHHAVAILGPVGEHEGRAAASRATELGIPIALLSPGDQAAAPEVGVFRLWSSPEWEAREAVRLAVQLGYDRLAVLSPRDEQGESQSEAFRVAATQAGAQVVAHGTYDPTATDLERDMKKFLGLDPRTNERLRRHLRRVGVKQGWKTFTPKVEFELLFIPDVYERAALVAAYLPFFNVEVRSQEVMDIVGLKRKHGGRVPQVVQLMGGSGWHNEGLIPRGGEVLEGALVLDVYAGNDNEEYASNDAAEFAQLFQARFGRLPGAVAAQAFDGALLVLAARKRAAGAKEPRTVFVSAMRGARLSSGACGPAVVAGDGELLRQAILLRVDSGTFVLHEY